MILKCWDDFPTSFESINQGCNIEIIFLSNNGRLYAENMLFHRHQRKADWELECNVENIYFSQIRANTSLAN